MRHITPTAIRAPFARYSYGVEIPAGYRLLVCSGQLGISPDDRVPAGIEEQTHLCFRNIAEVLKEANMSLADLVRISAFVVSREHLPGELLQSLSGPADESIHGTGVARLKADD